MNELSKTLSLRQTRPEDAQNLAELKVICWQHSYKGLVPDDYLARLNAEAEMPHWKSWLADENAKLISFVAEQDGRLLGYVMGGPMRSGDRPGEEIEADSETYAIYIHPDYQRLGIGQGLMAKLVSKLIEDGNRSMGVWMLGGNQKAEQFYEKIGGTEVAKRVDIRNNRIVFREKGWRWSDLKALKARMMLHSIGNEA